MLPGFIGEHEPMAAGRLLLQHRLHPRIQPVETLAHVHRLQGHKDPRRGRQTQHGRGKASSTERIQAGVAVAAKRATVPVGQRISAAQFCVGSPAESLSS